MFSTSRNIVATVAALAALALGGAALAGAADKTSSGTSSSGSNSSQSRAPRPPREALSSAVRAKIKAAALDKVPGATVVRTEAGGPYGTPYHAHIRTSGGARKVVLVNASFAATAVQADRGRGGSGRDGHGRGGPGRRETTLTGATKAGVEKAVLARYD